jgi:hypothetical protein
MLVRLDWKRLEPALVNVACPRGATVSVPALRMCHGEPPHEFRDLPVPSLERPDDEVPVAGHDAVRQDSQRLAPVRLQQHTLKCGVVVL